MSFETAGLKQSEAAGGPTGVAELGIPASRAMRQWYERAGVRVDPRRTLESDGLDGKHYWPPDLAPFVSHPLVVERGAALRDELLIRQLYQYLCFTANYESRVINPGTEMIANGRSGFDLPADMMLDAYKIYCDEGYHALYSFDVIRQVEAATGVPYRPYDVESLLADIGGIVARARSELRGVASLLVVVVFETLVTATLTQIPGDPNIVPLVREIVTDHARDEGRHHAFFSSVFPMIWGQLGHTDRCRLGVLLPEMIVRPLEPPQSGIRASLELAGMAPAEIDQVLIDSYPADATRESIRRTARATLRLFEHHDVYDDACVREAFIRQGLLKAAHAE